jgi:hypothetical protein
MSTRPFFSIRLVAIALVIGGCASKTPRAKQPAPSLPAPKGALGEIDRMFLDAYAASAAAAREAPHPVVIVSGSSLVLHLPGQEEQSVRVIPDIYDALKAVSHFGFAAYLRLRGAGTGPLTLEATRAVEALLDREPAARRHLAEFGLTPAQVSRQHGILQATTDLIREALSQGDLSPTRLQDYARDMGPLFLENAREAGCAQIEGTHRQMLEWRARHPREDWNRLVVVIRGVHQARYRNAATGYFHWLIGGEAPAWSYPGESERVIYEELQFGGRQALDLLATIVVDADAGDAFFGDEWRLSEDVLSDGASTCVAKLPQAERWSK